MVPISTIFEKLFCGRRSLDAEDAAGVELGKPLPGSDAVEASRRRYTSHLSCCWLGISPSLRNVERVQQEFRKMDIHVLEKSLHWKFWALRVGNL